LSDPARSAGSRVPSSGSSGWRRARPGAASAGRWTGGPGTSGGGCNSSGSLASPPPPSAAWIGGCVRPLARRTCPGSGFPRYGAPRRSSWRSQRAGSQVRERRNLERWPPREVVRRFPRRRRPARHPRRRLTYRPLFHPPRRRSRRSLLRIRTRPHRPLRQKGPRRFAPVRRHAAPRRTSSAATCRLARSR